MTDIELQDMVEQYLRTGLWISTFIDEPSISCDSLLDINDLPDEIWDTAYDDCAAFAARADTLLLEMPSDSGQIGRDLWLTRNRPRARFRDRAELYGGRAIADKLTEIAHEFGECDFCLYASDFREDLKDD